MKKIDWKPAGDAAIAVAGGAVLQNLAGNVPQLMNLVNKIPSPDLMGISLKAVLFGAVALLTAKYFMK